MKLALIGLGKMGSNMARRLINGGHTVMGYNRSAKPTETLAAETNLIPAFSLEQALSLLDDPKIVWTMVPAPIITFSLFRRFSSRQDESYAAKLLAAMRNQFGGHAVKRSK